MNDDGMKVTDKRMFNAEGELREEFRFLEGEQEEKPSTEKAAPARASGEELSAGQGEASEVRPQPAPTPPASVEAGAAEEGEPSFYDLVALLAEPVALYLGDAQLAEGESVENLELARLHIDLMKILQKKTAGNLSADEKALLDDLLYRFQMRYVQKRG